MGTDAKITGSNVYKETAGSEVVVITAGITRSPGISSDDLLLTNIEFPGSHEEEHEEH